MQTTKQLAADLEALQSGDSWLGYNAHEILEGISYKMAQCKAYESGNTIWQIINHISFWRETVARRLMEHKGIEEEHDGLDAPAIVNHEQWEITKQQFDKAFELLKKAILDFDGAALFREAGNRGSYYFNITGCIQHDAYHLGQVVILKKLAIQNQLNEKG